VLKLTCDICLQDHGQTALADGTHSSLCMTCIGCESRASSKSNSHTCRGGGQGSQTKIDTLGVLGSTSNSLQRIQCAISTGYGPDPKAAQGQGRCLIDSSFEGHTAAGRPGLGCKRADPLHCSSSVLALYEVKRSIQLDLQGSVI
jgi:hypothetical protein